MPLSDLIGSNILSFAQSIQDSRHTIEDVRNGRYESLAYTRTLKKLDGIPITVDAATRIFQIDGLAIAVTACGPQAGPNSGGGHPLRTWLGIVPIVVGIANKNWTIEVVSGDALSLIGRSVDASDATLLSSFTRPTPTQLERQQGDPQLFPQVFRGSGSSDPTELKCRAMLFSAFQPQDLSRSSSVPSVILTTCFLGLWIASRNLRCVFAESGLGTSCSVGFARRRRSCGSECKGCRAYVSAIRDLESDTARPASIHDRQRALHQPKHGAQSPFDSLQTLRRVFASGVG
jgi:hypothetical protein